MGDVSSVGLVLFLRIIPFCKFRWADVKVLPIIFRGLFITRFYYSIRIFLVCCVFIL